MIDPTTLLFPAFGLVMVIGAVGLVRKGRFYREQTARIADTPVSQIGSLRPGTVAVEGLARVDADAGTVTAELSGEEALVTRSKVVARQDHGATEDEDAGRHVIHEASHSVPFRVEDATGSVRVDPPDEADVRLDETVVRERGRGVPDAKALADHPDAADDGAVAIGDTPRWKDHERRYEQGAILPGEAVYILGDAVDRADWDGDDVELTGREKPRQFVVTDEGRASAQTGGKIGAYLAYGMGGVIGVIGALMLLFGSLALL